jgi:hypothetical protein
LTMATEKKLMFLTICQIILIKCYSRIKVKFYAKFNILKKRSAAYPQVNFVEKRKKPLPKFERHIQIESNFP